MNLLTFALGILVLAIAAAVVVRVVKGTVKFLVSLLFAALVVGGLLWLVGFDSVVNGITALVGGFP